MKYLLFMTLEQLQAVRADIEAALTRVDSLIAEQTQSSSPSDVVAMIQSLPRTKAIEWVLAQAKGKSLRPVEIWAALHLHGRNDPKMEVQVTTFDLWQRGRIGKSGRGQYHHQESAPPRV